MLSWYSIDCLKDPEFIDRLLKVFIFMWPWMNINFDVQQRFMKLLSFLSEDSLPGTLKCNHNFYLNPLILNTKLFNLQFAKDWPQ